MHVAYIPWDASGVCGGGEPSGVLLPAMLLCLEAQSLAHATGPAQPACKSMHNIILAKQAEVLVEWSANLQCSNGKMTSLTSCI